MPKPFNRNVNKIMYLLLMKWERTPCQLGIFGYGFLIAVDYV